MTTTKGNFSVAPSTALTAAVANNYTAVHVEQGVPVLDRDLNLLGDLIAAALQQALKAHIGTGVAGTTDFQIVTNGVANDFEITAGTCVVNGWDVTLGTSVAYSAQTATPPLPALTTPATSQTTPRIDNVYLDVWQTEVDDSAAPAGDPTLGNPGDVGVRTSTRIQTAFLVRVAEGLPVPAVTAGHFFYPLAQLSRPGSAVPTSPGSGTPGNTIADLRQTGLSVAPLVARIATLEAVLKPVITQIAPSVVMPGQTNPIVVTGKNFDYGTPTVLIGSVAATVSPGTVSATSLAVSVPATAVPGVWPLTVTNAIGTGTSPNPVTVETPPPPPMFVVGGATPQIAPAAATVGSTVTLNGVHFSGVNRVTLNASSPVYATPGAGLLSVSDTVITFTVPTTVPAVLTVGATMTVSVGIDGTSAVATSTALFTVASPPIPTPMFGNTGSQITPTSTVVTVPAVTQAPGGVIFLNGTNFGTSTATTTVSLVGATTVPAASTDYVSVAAAQIEIKVPAGAPAGKYKVAVVVGGIEALSSDQLTVS